MSIWDEIGRQLRHPRGAAGRLAGRFMRLVNARPYALAVAALAPRPDDDVLELGCGPGHGVRLLAARTGHGRIHAVDQSATMLAQAEASNRAEVWRGRVHLCQGRFEALPFPDRSMDKVLAVNVAYFWHDAEAVLREVRRVLRPGGVLAIYVTHATSMRRWKFADAATHRMFDRAGLTDMLRGGGFAAEAVSVARVPVLPGVAGLIATAVVQPATQPAGVVDSPA